MCRRKDAEEEEEEEEEVPKNKNPTQQCGEKGFSFADCLRPTTKAFAGRRAGPELKTWPRKPYELAGPSKKSMHFCWQP